MLIVGIISCNTLCQINVALGDSDSTKNDKLKLECFTGIPSEIQGGATMLFYLSSSDRKAGKYICITDMGSLAYIVNNGKPIVLGYVDNIKTKDVYYYSSNNYKLKVEVKKVISQGDETSVFNAVLTIIDIKNKNMKTVLNVICEYSE